MIILSSILSFIFGVLVAAVGFLFTYSARLTRMETQLISMKEKMDKAVPVVIPCADHIGITNRLAVLESECKGVEGRVSSLEVKI